MMDAKKKSKTTTSNWHMCYSVISSLCGVLASAFFKKTFDVFMMDSYLDIFKTISILQILQRIVYFVLFIFFNMLMMKFYLQLMKHYSVTFSTVLNFLFNFLLSALVGYFFFKEKRNVYWFGGVFCVICGLLLIMKDAQTEKKTKPKEK